MVLIFNNTVSREISQTNFTPTRAIKYTYIYIWRASEASETLSRSSMENAIRIYIYIYYAPPPRCSIEINVFELG